MNKVFRDVSDNEIVLADTVETTILEKHPEVADFLDNQNFVSTIYATDKIKSGEILWTKSE